MGSLHRLLCVGIGLICFANLMHMSGISTPKWRMEYFPEDIDPDGELMAFSGLFEQCTPDQYTKGECRDYDFDSVNMKHQVLQVLAYLAMVSGLIGAGAAIILQIIVFLSPQVRTVTVLVTICISTTSCLAAFGFILSMLSLYSDRFIKENMNLAYSFFLCMLGMLFFLSGGVVVTYASKSIACGYTSVQSQPQPQQTVPGTAVSMIPEHKDETTVRFRPNDVECNLQQ